MNLDQYLFDICVLECRNQAVIFAPLAVHLEYRYFLSYVSFMRCFVEIFREKGHEWRRILDFSPSKVCAIINVKFTLRSHFMERLRVRQVDVSFDKN